MNPPSPTPHSARAMILSALREFPHARPILSRGGQRARRSRSTLGVQGWLTRTFVALAGYVVGASALLNFCERWSDAPWFRAVATSIFCAGIAALLTGAVLLFLRDGKR